MYLGLNIWNLAENSQKLIAIATRSPLLHMLPSRKLFGKCIYEDVVHGDVMYLRHPACLFVDLVRNVDADAHMPPFKAPAEVNTESATTAHKE